MTDPYAGPERRDGSSALDRAVGRIEGRLDGVHEVVTKVQKDVDSLKTSRARMVGGLTVLAGLGGVAGSAVTLFLGSVFKGS